MKGHQWGKTRGSTSELQPELGTSHWDVSFSNREDRLFSRAAPANTTTSWPNTREKPQECQLNTANMETDFPAPNVCASICPHSSIHRGKASSLGTGVLL